ncbi:hypothetical protein F-E9_3 [Faustovirus]|nr:hypothetical protein F-E9_3 [Faustovirus]
MQDVIDNHLIKLSPVEFLDVSKQTRKVALEWIHTVRTSCRDNDYYKIINCLTKYGKANLIAAFTKDNFNSAQFIERLKYGAVIHAPRHISVAYRYIKYYDDRAIYDMLNSFIDTLGVRLFLRLADTFDKTFIRGNMFIEMLIHPLLFDGEGVVSRKYWDSEAGTETIKFIIKFYPDFVIDYVTPFANGAIDEPYNIDTNCMKLIINLGCDILNPNTVDKVIKKLDWMDDMEHYEDLTDDPDSEIVYYDLHF